MKFDKRALINERLDDWVDVVGTACRFGHERPEVDVGDGVDIE